MQEIATRALPSGDYQSLSFSNDGNQLLVGTSGYERRKAAAGIVNTPGLGAMWVDWANEKEVPQVRLIPPERFVPNSDSRIHSMGLDAATALAIAGTSLPGRFDEQLWLLNINPRIAPQLVYPAPHLPTPARRDTGALIHALSGGRTHLLLVAVEGPRRFLEIIPLLPFGPARRVQLADAQAIEAVAVNAAQTHFAWADQWNVVCSAFDTGEVCRWPCTTQVRQLSFAEDDLALWGMNLEAVTLFQWKGGQSDFKVPGMTPRAIDGYTRSAMFFRDCWEYREVDLTSGSRRCSGNLTEHPFSAFHLKRRLYATLDLATPGPRVRVYELPD